MQLDPRSVAPYPIAGPPPRVRRVRVGRGVVGVDRNGTVHVRARSIREACDAWAMDASYRSLQCVLRNKRQHVLGGLEWRYADTAEVATWSSFGKVV